MRKGGCSQLNKVNNAFGHRYNNGFTLVELIVVLMLLSILLSISIFGVFAWQDSSRFKVENANAEMIFYAAQNQLNEFAASGAIKTKVQQPLKGENGKYNYVLASANSSPEELATLSSIIGEDGRPLQWSEIWAQSNNSSRDQGVICSVSIEPGDYAAYIADPKGFAAVDENKGKKVFFDLVSSYIQDKNILDANIVIEFSPDAAQVFAVLYSDRSGTLKYESNPVGATSILNRTEAKRRENMLGYYGVDTMSKEIKGRGKDTIDAKLSLINDEFLRLEMELGSSIIIVNNDYYFTIYDGAGAAGTELMRFKISGAELGEKMAICNNARAAEKSPCEVDVTFLKGLFAGETITDIRIPIWKDPSDSKKINILLDAADFQAQSITYARMLGRTGDEANGTDPGMGIPSNANIEAKAAFMNTYSFFRFGLNDYNRIYCAVSFTDSGIGKKSNIEYTTFKSIERNVTIEGISGTATVYTIENGRHFYNLRFVEDYKEDMSEKNIFKLVSDIDWNEFTGVNGGQNYFLNSYAGASKTVGINYSGGTMIDFEGSIDGETNTTANVPFPGFLALAEGDIFTQDVAEGEEPEFKISNLRITVDGNVIYGLYDTVTNKSMAVLWDDDFGNYNFADINEYARKGMLPLGLFAENYGTISNIVLENHKVIGLREFQNTIVYSNKVGGFAGDNFGNLVNVKLLGRLSKDYVSGNLENYSDSFVNGHSDVGGIVGHQNRTVTLSTEVNYAGYISEATVTGKNYVGGIIGRICTISNGNEWLDDSYDDSVKNGIAKKSRTDGAVFSAVTKFTIEGCDSYGRVSADQSITMPVKVSGYSEMYDNGDTTGTANPKYNAAVFVGGITGAAMGRDTSIRNCRAYNLYAINEINSIISSQDSMGKATKSYFTGGIVGYALNSTIADCSTEVADKDEIGNELKNSGGEVYVFGGRYTGGFAGCMNGAIILDSENDFVVNKANVIGELYTGGIAGCIGKTTVKDASYSFVNSWNLDKNNSIFVYDIDKAFYASKETFASDGASDYVVSDLQNSGIVLSTAQALLLAEDENADVKAAHSSHSEVSGCAGGIAGISSATLNNCRNIQTEEIKAKTLKLITGQYYSSAALLDDISPYGDISEKTNVQGIIAQSLFGGCNNGGIVGLALSGCVLNDKNAYQSEVDAIVFGDDHIGGIVGGTYDSGSDTQSGDTVFKHMHLSKYSDGSSGAYILGRDMVGGFIGSYYSINGENGNGIINPLNDYTVENDSQTEDFHVKGRYGIGGFIGALLRGNSDNVLIGFDSGHVEGECYVGGLVGLQESIAGSFGGSVNGMKIGAKYFAGGMVGIYYGLVKENGSLFYSDINVGNDVNNEIEVSADMYSGGMIGGLIIPTASIETDNSSEIKRLFDNDIFALANILTLADISEVAGIVSNSETNGALEPLRTSMFEADFEHFNSGSSNVEDSGLKVISENEYAGGLIGYLPYMSKVEIKNAKCYMDVTAGDVFTSDEHDLYGNNIKYAYVGGVTGRIGPDTEVAYCTVYSETELNSDATYYGRLVEVNDGIMKNNYIDEFIYSGDSVIVGGFAGLNGEKGRIDVDTNDFLWKMNSNVSEADQSLGIFRYDSFTMEGGVAVGAFVGENRGFFTTDSEQIERGVSIISRSIGQKTESNGYKATETLKIIGCSYTDGTIGILAGYNNSESEVIIDSNIFKGDFENSHYSGLFFGTNGGILNGNYVDSGDLTGSVFISNNKDINTSGIFVGYNTEGGNIKNCLVGSNAALNGEFDNVAGIAGRNDSNIEDCINASNLMNAVAGNKAGVAAIAEGGIITGCYNISDISASDSAAGILGKSTSAATIEDSINMGTISADSGITAGIAVDTKDGVIKYSRNYGYSGQYGITYAPADELYGNLEASGLNEGPDGTSNPIGPLSNGRDKTLLVRNFYIFGNYENASGDALTPYGEGRTKEVGEGEEITSIDVEDLSGWPVHLYSFTDTGHKLVYRRYESYYDSGVIGLTDEASVENIALLIQNAEYGKVKAIDNAIIEMIRNEIDFPNYDEEDKQGFVKTP